MEILKFYKNGLNKLHDYMKQYAFEKDGWTALENVEFFSHQDVVNCYPFNEEFLDWLVTTGKIDLEKTEEYFWKEGLKPVNFGKYLDDMFGNNDDYRILFLIDVLK